MKHSTLLLSLTLCVFAPACDSGGDGDGETSSSGTDMGATEVDEAAVQAALDAFPTGFERISAMPFPSEGHAAAVDVHVWVQSAGAEAYRGIDPAGEGSNPTIPEGLILVKEQFDDMAAVTGHTVMVKGPAGLAPASADWWWGFADADKQLANTGQIDFCIDCHAARPSDDWLFGVETDNRN